MRNWYKMVNGMSTLCYVMLCLWVSLRLHEFSLIYSNQINRHTPTAANCYEWILIFTMDVLFTRTVDSLYTGRGSQYYRLCSLNSISCIH